MTKQAAHLPVMGLYYPYVHFRDERWLKLAALYWPRMARIVTPGYPTHDSELVRRLNDELGFVVDVSPVTARRAVAAPFTDFIDSLGPNELARWSVTNEGPYGIDACAQPISHEPTGVLRGSSRRSRTTVMAAQRPSRVRSAGDTERAVGVR
jgi:hypothetical protein